jgi:hypothetical protein
MRLRIPIVALALLASSLARAQTTACESLGSDSNHRVYIQSADTQVPTLISLGTKLANLADPVFIIYTAAGSCTNLNLINTNADFTPNKAAGAGTFYIPTGFDPTTMTPPACTPPPPGVKADMAITIVFPDKTDCPTAADVPATVSVTQGAVQAMVFVVPGGVGGTTGSTQTTITAEEGYLLAGLGPTKAGVAPWSDPNYFYGRTATKGTQISIGANIGVAAARWALINDTSHMIDQSLNVVSSVAGQTTTGNAEKTIGILGAEVYDTARSMIHSLAFRAFKQYKSYWPDSSSTTFDKKNIRDGHYPIWSYVQYFLPQASGAATKANAQLIVDLLTNKPGVTIDGTHDAMGDVIGAGLVPQCAMNVSRTVEGGPLSVAPSATPCNCFFDFSTTQATSCTACTDDSTCGTGKCRRGYCEAK